MLNFTKVEVLGLDIGSSSVKVVRLRKDDGDYAVTGAGVSEIAPDASFSVANDIGGEDDNHRNTIKAIRECFESAGSGTKLAVCGLSGQEVAVREFEFPLLLAEEIEGAVLFEASQVCPFNTADIVVDYHIIPKADTHASDKRGDDKTRGILVAATNALIKNKAQLAKEAALKCVLMDVEGLALLNCFNNLADESEKATIAILNVGGTGTTVAIMGVNGWPFIRDMTFAGDDIIKQIAADKSMSTEDVKEILFGDSNRRGRTRTELHDSLEKACQKMVVDVNKTLRYYAVQERSTPVEKIFICGGFALAQGFVELLNSKLRAEVVLWNPFDKIRCDAVQQCPDIFDKKGPALAVAVGLAMRSV